MTQCKLKRIYPRNKDGFVRYVVVDPGGNEIKCKSKESVADIKEKFVKYQDRINARNHSADKILAEGRHRFASQSTINKSA